MKKQYKPSRRFALAALLLGALVATTAEATNITYNVNETITGPLNGTPGNPTQTDSVIGSITTNGTIGILHASNIVSWDLDLIDVTKPQFSTNLTNSNSTISIDLGSVLSADATNLYFNFSGSGAIAFQASSPGAFSGYHYWCLNADWFGCLIGNSIAPNNVYLGATGDDLVVAATGTQGQVGNSPLNQNPPVPVVPVSVPEPSTIWLLVLGIFVGFSLVSRRSQSLI